MIAGQKRHILPVASFAAGREERGCVGKFEAWVCLLCIRSIMEQGAAVEVLRGSISVLFKIEGAFHWCYIG